MNSKIALLLFVIICVIIVFCVALKIFVFVKYGDTPIGEIPTWAYVFLNSNGK